MTETKQTQRISIKMKLYLKTIIAGITLLSSSIAFSQDEQKKTEEPNPAKLKINATKKKVTMPGITIHRDTKEIHIEAEICLQAGILEYVVCKPDTFEHESIFTTKAKPELIHASMLLIGMQTTPLLSGISELWAEKAIKQKLSRVKIEVEWLENNKKKRINLNALIKQRINHQENFGAPQQKKKKIQNDPPIKDAWIFAGSFLHKNKQTGKTFYAANSSGIIVGIWPDNSTVIQYGIISRDPHKGKDDGYEINEKNIPKNTTKVKLVISLLDTPNIPENRKK